MSKEEALTNPAQPVVVRAGTDVTITLDANETTGYRWQLVGPPDPAVARLVAADYTPDDHPPGMVGVGGRSHWRVWAVAPGRTTLTLENLRIWMPQEAEATTFTIIVEPRAKD